MNRKVFITMLTLCIGFLVGMYVLKFFFPERFMMNIQSARLLEIGHYIDSNPWLFHTVGIFTAFLTYLLFCSAGCGRLCVRWYELLLILLTVGTIRAFSFIDDRIAIVIEDSAFFILPWLFGGSLRNTAITFTVHGFSQMLSLSIRNLTVYLIDINFITMFILGIESYLWLILLVIVFNHKTKKEV